MDVTEYSEYQDLMKKYNKCESKLSEYKHEIEKWESKYRSLKEDYEKHSKYKKEIERWEDRYKKLEEKLIRKEKEWKKELEEYKQFEYDIRRLKAENKVFKESNE